MRIFTVIIVFFFTSFLVVPTVVSIINHDADISVFYDLEEDSNEKEISIKEVKIVQEFFSYNFRIFYKQNRNKISIYHDAIISNNFASIFSPPPELI